MVASFCGRYDITYNVDPNRTTNPGVPIASLYLISFQFKYRGVGFKWEQGCRPIFTEVTLMWLMRFLPGTAGAHWGQLGKCDRWVTQGWFLLSPLPLPFVDEYIIHVCVHMCFFLLFNFWSPNPVGHTRLIFIWRTSPWGLEELIVFSVCPFPDESAHVCQWVHPLGSYSRFLNFWPLKPPKCPLGYRGANCF